VLAIRSLSPNIIVLPLPDYDRAFSIYSAKTLLDILPKKVDTIAMGMDMYIKNPEPLIYIINRLKKVEQN
jgi:hypothetical protein